MEGCVDGQFLAILHIELWEFEGNARAASISAALSRLPPATASCDLRYFALGRWRVLPLRLVLRPPNAWPFHGQRVKGGGWRNT